MLVVLAARVGAQQTASSENAKQSDAKTKQGNSFKVFAALRTPSWVPYPGGPALRPNSPNEIVLWVRIQDAPADWPSVDAYVQLGERRFEYMSKSVSVLTSAGTPLHHAAFLVPKDALELSLVVGSHPALRFQVDPRILPSIDATSPPK